VFNALVSEHGDRLRKLGAVLAATMLAKRLPGPLRWLAELFISGMKGDRGFGFWWLVVTLGVALGVGALVALLVLPVAALIALIAVGIWMLVRRARTKDDDQDRANQDDDQDRANGSRGGGNGGREPALAGAPS
jgi:Flp pilus assembly protein TadB